MKNGSYLIKNTCLWRVVKTPTGIVITAIQNKIDEAKNIII